MTTQSWLFSALYLYLALLFVKNSVESRGAARSASFVAALFVIPSAAFIHLAGNWDLSPTGMLNSPAAPWVIAVPNPSGGAANHLNIVLGVFTLSLMYLVATLVVALFTSVYDRRGTHVHALYKPFVKWGIVLFGVFFYLGMSGIGISTLFLGMGALSIVIGFALQETLANLFTGIALDVEGVVKQGNWISLDQNEAGRVVEKGWRSTMIRTIRDETVVLPNKSLAGGKLTAYGGAYAHAHARLLTVSAAYREPPLKVKEILRQIMLDEPKILKSPEPRAYVSNYGDHSIEYRLMFWIEDFSDHLEVEDAVLTAVWYAFEADGVEIPFPIRNVIMKTMEEEHREKDAHRRASAALVRFLGHIGPLEEHLGRSELEFLGANAAIRSYHPGEQLLTRGEIGDSVYFVQEGWCEVKLPTGETKKLGPGEFFGEMALFHKGHRTADVHAGPEGSVVARIGRDPILTVFRSHPDLETAFALTHEIRSEESGLDQVRREPPKPTFGELASTFVRRWLLPW